MIKVVATLMDVMTGYVGRHEYEVQDDYADDQEFMWSDGNYGCDCNRSIFLYGHDPDYLTLPCSWHPGQDNQIVCISLEVDGAEVYSELQNM